MLYKSGLTAYTKNLRRACTMLPNKLEIPKKIGCRSIILVSRTVLLKNSEEIETVGKNNFIKNGVRKNAIADTKTIPVKKAEKIASTKPFPPSSDLSIFSTKNGMRIDADTTDAPITRMRSGMRNAA